MTRPRRHQVRALSTAIAVVFAMSGAALAFDTTDGPAPSAALGTAAAEALATVPAPEPALDPVADIELVSVVDPTLPVPAPPPTNAYAPTPEYVHGMLRIPAIGLEQPLYEGVTLTSINRGPSHWPGTAIPGQLGNVVVAGHRTTYTRPFWDLDRLQPGDQLVFTTLAGRFVYELSATEVVLPTGLHIIEQTAEHTATLFACHPKGSARQRIVATFGLVESSASGTVGGAAPA